ncbi:MULTISPECIES: polysaccharide deacetylase family protein [Acidobacteriaceae]|uniref:polysaccharide deacetylase family protein n=1 Tax=Acidobacteriaceae TaxID=204434 RepID=UPI00131BA8CB|nr:MULTISPECIES: polysaccharide deacetylase family protein [Acidobacteriaceae]MDW5267385.1 polysaccharide deacetylase family protein [Edaphobacter sp.]
MTSIQLAAAAALTTAAVAGAAAYAALWPQSQLFGRVLVAGPNPDEIALTYDDGPNDAATERLLEVLARHQAHATFFLIGSFARQRPALVRSIAAAGHIVGNHTMTHPWLSWQSAARIRQELAGCNAVLEDTLGAPIHFFRAPHGARRPVVLRIARELGLTAVQWNITAFDWNPIPADEILGNVTRGIERNQARKRASNVLLHDGGHLGIGQPRMSSVEATDLLLQRYKLAGMRFVTVANWA